MEVYDPFADMAALLDEQPVWSGEEGRGGGSGVLTRLGVELLGAVAELVEVGNF